MSEADDARRLTFPARIQRFMVHEGLSKRETAELWHISRMTLTRYLKVKPQNTSKQVRDIVKFLDAWEYDNLYYAEEDCLTILNAIQRTKSLSVFLAYAGALTTSLACSVFYSTQNGVGAVPFTISGSLSKCCVIAVEQEFLSGVHAKLTLRLSFMHPPCYEFSVGSKNVPGYRSNEIKGHLTSKAIKDVRTIVLNEIVKQEI